MAIEKTVITPQGFEAVNAYHRVSGVSLIEKNKINFSVQSYKSNGNPVEFAFQLHSCQYDLNGNNPIVQAYNHLKTLPEFAGGKDC